MIKTLREYIQDAQEGHYAIGHFNVANSEGLMAVFEAAVELDVPVIVGASEGERDFIGIERIVAMVRSLREKYDFPIFLNADHTYSVERVREAIDAGFDAVIYDGVTLSVEENIAHTKACVDYARASGRDIVVESELGFIGKSSKVLDSLPEGAQVTDDLMTTATAAKEFISATGIDMLAPAIGNVHGMLKGGLNPHLNKDRVKEIAETVKIPLVLHGGSGSAQSDIVDVIAAGIAVVHISTELRVAFRKGLEAGLADNPAEVAPYRYMEPAIEAMKQVVLEKLRLCNNI